MRDLTYRPMHPDDFDALHAIVSHWSVTRQLGRWPWPANADFTASRCKPYVGDGFVWAVCQNDAFIGTMAVTRGELGYMFSPTVQGQGIATKAARAAITQAFSDPSQNQIKASTWHDNRASARVLQKLGFRHVATHYEHAAARRIPTLVLQHHLTRTAWDSLSHPAQ